MVFDFAQQGDQSRCKGVALDGRSFGEGERGWKEELEIFLWASLRRVAGDVLGERMA